MIEAFLQNKERVSLSALAAHLRREGVALGVRLVRALQILGLPFWTLGATTYTKARARQMPLIIISCCTRNKPQRPRPPPRNSWFCCCDPRPLEQTDIVVHLEQTITHQRVESTPFDEAAFEARLVAGKLRGHLLERR